MIIQVDRNIYSDSCIDKAIYNLSDRFTITRKLVSSATEELTVTIKDNTFNDVKAEDAVIDTLNDFKLRDTIEKETHDIRVILYAKAFGDFDNVSDFDIE